MTPFEIFLCIVLVGVSAFMSASEVALFSLSRFQVRAVKDRYLPAYQKIKRLLGDPSGLLITILVVNELVNISLSTLIASSVASLWSSHPSWATPLIIKLQGLSIPDWLGQTLLGTLITAPIVLFLCEITPKVVAARANQIVGPLCASPLSVIYDLMKPIRLLLRRLLGLMSRAVRAPAQEESSKGLLKTDEFLVLLEEGHKEGSVHESELDLIRNVLELDETSVSEIYTPLHELHTLPQESSLQGALELLQRNQFSRIPVTTQDRTKIVGILYAKDLIFSPDRSSFSSTPVTRLMRKPFVVNPSMRVNALFRKMKQNRTHIAVIEGERPQELGIVTMHDVLISLFDDLLEEGKTP